MDGRLRLLGIFVRSLCSTVFHIFINLLSCFSLMAQQTDIYPSNNPNFHFVFGSGLY